MRNTIKKGKGLVEFRDHPLLNYLQLLFSATWPADQQVLIGSPGVVDRSFHMK